MVITDPLLLVIVDCHCILSFLFQGTMHKHSILTRKNRLAVFVSFNLRTFLYFLFFRGGGYSEMELT
ncbi:hypothetical protein K450DRAFT_220204 [Umbelopsis ramanniana AG]|uniref:Uncharacterized protein n=1 Tax=Umbelopsis ramanniana AG TaxID=1314678 RepID=A0AAD5EIS9_UMBRA|nr:uncharacterized protein K450DRAFT_220204 [Umbelopsis ramanniana AG]KAI8583835.1 hypothetical protein K450DRAFT_220204 [Umbelopsis ramanniana AG]